MKFSLIIAALVTGLASVCVQATPMNTGIWHDSQLVERPLSCAGLHCDDGALIRPTDFGTDFTTLARIPQPAPLLSSGNPFSVSSFSAEWTPPEDMGCVMTRAGASRDLASCHFKDSKQFEIPEPMTLFLIGSGLIAMSLSRLKWRRII